MAARSISALAFALASAAAASSGVRGSSAASSSASSSTSASAVPAGNIIGLFSNGATGGCDLWQLSPSTGDNATIARSLKMCDGVTQFFPSVATAGADGALVVAIGTGASIFSIDTASAAQTVLAPMPGSGLNDSNWPLGLVFVPAAGASAGALYIVFQTDIYEVAGGALRRLPIDISVPQYSQVTSCPECGTGGAAAIFVADEGTSTIYVFDLGAMDSPSTLKSGVKGDMDLQWSASLKSLIQLQSYTLYKTNPTTGKSTRIGAVPDGPGYPRVNAVSPDGGSTIAIIDFSNVFTIDLTSGKVGEKNEFHLAPRIVGQPQWYA